MVAHVTTEEFQGTVLDVPGPVLVDFFATWCGPCKMLAPVLDEVAQELPDAAIYKVDVDKDPALAQRYGVMSVPTLIVFRDGQVVEQFVGPRPKAELVGALS